jgi:hypothetical protein
VLVKVIEHGAVTIISAIPLSGSTSQIVEYHDCQRFIEGNQYGALYAIFADSVLDSLPFQLLEADSQAHLAGRAYGPVAAATIYSYGGTTVVSSPATRTCVPHRLFKCGPGPDPASLGTTIHQSRGGIGTRCTGSSTSVSGAVLHGAKWG